MAKRDRELLQNTVVLGIGQLVPKVISLVILPILTKYLTTAEYGMYDFVLSVASLLIPLVSLQIQQGVFRYLLDAKSTSEKSVYITCAVSFIILTSTVVFLIVGLTYSLFGYEKYAVLIALIYFFESLYNLNGQIVRGLGCNLKYSFGTIAFAVANCIALIVSVMFLQTALYGVLLSLALAYFIADAYLFVSVRLWKYLSFKSIEKEALSALLSFSLPIVPSSISLWVVNLSDRMLIIHFLGAAANGIYSVPGFVRSQWISSAITVT